MSEVIQLLDAVRHGDPVAADKLLPLVKLRFFVGLTNKECAEVLEVSEPTVERWWTFARAWLFREIRPNGRD